MLVKRTGFFHDRRRIEIIILIVLIAAIIAVAIPLSFFRANSANPNSDINITEPQSFSVGPDASLVLKEQGGNVSVFPAKTSEITITPRKHQTTIAPATNEVQIRYDQVLNAQGNDQITVSTDPWFSNTDFYVTIPASAT